MNINLFHRKETFRRIKCLHLMVLVLLFLIIVGCVFIISLKLKPSLDGSYAQIDDDVFVKLNFKDAFDMGVDPFGLKNDKLHLCSIMKYIKRKRDPVALVSYPGSGNTWLRYLLQQSTGFYTGSIYNDQALLKNGFPGEGITNGSVLVIKTHEYGPEARKQFKKAIILIRNAIPAIQAEFNRKYEGHIGVANLFVMYSNYFEVWTNFVQESLKEWKNFYTDWLRNFTGPVHLIHYEDMVSDLENNLLNVFQFLDVSVNKCSLSCTITQKKGLFKRPSIPGNPMLTKGFTKEVAEAQNYIYNLVEEKNVKKSAKYVTLFLEFIKSCSRFFI